MTIRLPSDAERDILAEVQSGRFASVDDALAQAWRSFRRQRPSVPQTPGQGLIGRYARMLNCSTRPLSTP